MLHVDPRSHAHDPSAFADLPRRLGSVGEPGGATLVCIAGLHGNEPPGLHALARVLETLQHDPAGLVGRLVCLAGNRAALARGQRFLGEDLNRIWSEERVERVRRGAESGVPEEAEMRELDEELTRELTACPTARVLDLHSTSGDGPAFATIDDTLANRDFGFALPVPHVLGLEEELPATLVGYLNTLGHTAIGFEAGQHTHPDSVERAEAAVWTALDVVGALAPGSRPEVARARARLERDAKAGAVEVRYRHPVAESDGFAMLPGFRSFDPVRRGQVLGHDARGPVECPRDGLILMPLYQAQGSDGFFVIQRVSPVWLALSAWLRLRRLDRVLHWLPGVRRHPEQDGVLLVDPSRARWLATQLFHLLGFRRRSGSAPMLEMVRRESF